MENKNKISCSSGLFLHLKNKFNNYQEEVYLIGLNNNNEILINKLIFFGGCDSSIIDLRIIFKELFLNNCTRFFIAHNHPSGNIKPSKEDDIITDKIKKAGDLLNCKLLDHLIFSDKNFFSYFDNNKL